MTNLAEVNFLDVTFNLRNRSYRPYKKPNDELNYINVFSNYPPQILKQLTTTISDRLSRNSSSELIFNESKHQYEDALSKTGKRKITWFNPPYNQNVLTNIAKIFLKLVDKHFPRTNQLPKIFNRNTIKISRSCMQNKKNKTTLSCNCRDNNRCPLNGNCRTENVTYVYLTDVK